MYIHCTCTCPTCISFPHSSQNAAVGLRLKPGNRRESRELTIMYLHWSEPRKRVVASIANLKNHLVRQIQVLCRHTCTCVLYICMYIHVCTCTCTCCNNMFLYVHYMYMYMCILPSTDALARYARKQRKAPGEAAYMYTVGSCTCVYIHTCTCVRVHTCTCFIVIIIVFSLVHCRISCD